MVLLDFADLQTSRPEEEVEEAGGDEEDGENAEAEEWHGIEEDGEAEEGEEEDEDEEADEASDSDLPNFAGLDADDFADGEVEEEPSFDDGLLPAWSGVPIHTALKQAMVRLGFVAPTDIQERAVPSALEGHDIVGVAETVSMGGATADNRDPEKHSLTLFLFSPTSCVNLFRKLVCADHYPHLSSAQPVNSHCR